jgi:hypothetical protein
MSISGSCAGWSAPVRQPAGRPSALSLRAHVHDELATTGDLERDACVGQGISDLARHAGQPRETIGDVVGHSADKRDITFGVYTQGASEAQWRACVEAVWLPPETLVPSN